MVLGVGTMPGWVVPDTPGVPAITVLPRGATPVSPSIPAAHGATGSPVSRHRTKNKNTCVLAALGP